MPLSNNIFVTSHCCYLLYFNRDNKGEIPRFLSFVSQLPHGSEPLNWRLNQVHSPPKHCPCRCRSVSVFANGLLSEGRAPLFHLPQHLPGPGQLWLRALLLPKVYYWALEQTGASRSAGLPRVPQDLHRSSPLAKPQVVQHCGALFGLPTGRHPQRPEELLSLQGPREGQALLPHRQKPGVLFLRRTGATRAAPSNHYWRGLRGDTGQF